MIEFMWPSYQNGNTVRKDALRGALRDPLGKFNEDLGNIKTGDYIAYVDNVYYGDYGDSPERAKKRLILKVESVEKCSKVLFLGFRGGQIMARTGDGVLMPVLNPKSLKDGRIEHSSEIREAVQKQPVIDRRYPELREGAKHHYIIEIYNKYDQNDMLKLGTYIQDNKPPVPQKKDEKAEAENKKRIEEFQEYLNSPEVQKILAEIKAKEEAKKQEEQQMRNNVEQFFS